MAKISFAGPILMVLAIGCVPAFGKQAAQAGVSSLVQDGKVVVINTSSFPGKIGELKQKYEQVESQFKDRYTKLQNLDKEVKQLETDLSTKAAGLSPDKLQEMKARYDEMKKVGTRELEDAQADYAKQIDVQTKPIRDKLSTFIDNYAKQHGIILIIDLPGAYQTGTLAYVNQSVDITDDFVNEYNKANPVPGGGAAAPAGATPASTAPKPAPKKP